MTFDVHKELARPRNLVLFGLVFSVANAYAIYKDFALLGLLPVAVLLGLVMVYKPRWAVLFIAFTMPLSINFEDIAQLGGIGISLPTEPIMVGLMFLYVLHLGTGGKVEAGFVRHPLTLVIMGSVVWMLITTLTSSIPVVSAKFLLARLWFLMSMYFVTGVFMGDAKFLRHFLLALIGGMGIVIVYTLLHHASYAFGEKPAHWVMYPFFKDHTSYGALIALLLPLVIFHFWQAPWASFQKYLFTALLGLFLLGLLFSYTRAAWVSLGVALPVWLLIRLKVDMKLIVLALAVLVGLFFAFEDTISHQLSKNSQDSSGDFREHIQSITNVSSDASNLERLNRWNSALRMFAERPHMGYGPGTYMFQYAIFQKSRDKTIISTNQADGGNAHSEYLGPLSEQGWPGALFVLLVFGMSLYVGIKLYYKVGDPYTKGLVMCMVLGLVTYYVHGALNNFLDTDKASVPVWGFMAAFVAIQLQLKRGTLT